MEIRKIDFEDVKPYIEDAAREHVPLRDKGEYYGVFDPDLKGFNGIVWHKDHAYFCYSYIFPNERGRGYHHALDKYRIELARQRGLHIITARITDMQLKNAIKLGFRPLYKTKKGYIKAIMEI